MTEEEKTALLAAMYDEEDSKKPLTPLEPTGKKSRRIVMGAVKYDVPTVEHIDLLEKRIKELENIIILQNRTLKRFDIMFLQFRQVLRVQNGSINELNQDMRSKIDRGF